MANPLLFPLAIVSAILLPALPGQTVPPVPAVAPAKVGKPLPPLAIDPNSEDIEITLDGSKTRTEITKGGITFGDIHLTADKIIYLNTGKEEDSYILTASGHVVLTRGDEKVIGESFLFNGKDGNFYTQEASISSPPFYVSGTRIQRTNQGAQATGGYFSPTPDGKGEFHITAQEIEIVNDRYLVLRRASFYLFGTRILTLRRYRLLLRRGVGKERDEYKFTVPLTVRTSKIGGVILGLNLPFSLGRDYQTRATIDLPSKRATQYRFSVAKELIGDRTKPTIQRGGFLDPTRDLNSTTDESPLRRFLRARPPLPPPDPVLDFVDILPSTYSLSQPTRSTSRSLRASVALAGNQEITDRRQGLLLLSRSPELEIGGQLPLARPAPLENVAARAYLRSPRFVLNGDAVYGEYNEHQVQQSEARTRTRRIATTIGIGTLPLLVGSRVLVRPQVSLTSQVYGQGSHYQILESNLAADYIFGTRTAIGAVYISRLTSGSTPFSFDLIDTQKEAQLRAQVAVGREGRYTVAFLGRYDVSQKQFFDYQVALGIRGKAIEPRITYKKLGAVFGIAITLPGISP